MRRAAARIARCNPSGAGVNRFRDQAARLLPLAARALGWGPETFWAATPADLALSLADPRDPAAAATPITRTELDRLLESDRHG